MSKRDEDRDARLAQALRENLRRRKAQTRGIVRDEGAPEEGLHDPPEPSARS